MLGFKSKKIDYSCPASFSFSLSLIVVIYVCFLFLHTILVFATLGFASLNSFYYFNLCSRSIMNFFKYIFSIFFRFSFSVSPCKRSSLNTYVRYCESSTLVFLFSSSIKKNLCIGLYLGANAAVSLQELKFDVNYRSGLVSKWVLLTLWNSVMALKWETAMPSFPLFLVYT